MVVTKQQLIDEYMSAPIKVGDLVFVRGLGTQNKMAFSNSTRVLEVLSEGVIITNSSKVSPENYRKNPLYIGKYPITDTPWNAGIKFHQTTLYCLVAKAGLKLIDDEYVFVQEDFSGFKIDQLNWNPTVGDEIHYQRGYCWDLRDKQLLIDSIYNRLDIGKFVLRIRSMNEVLKRAKNNLPTAFYDIVDGKQRLNAITSFLMNEFPDLNGWYWRDISNIGQKRFINSSNVVVGEIGEQATDVDVKRAFLGINYTGRVMSEEHLEFVKSINI